MEAEKLIDVCYALLNKAYEESYGKGYNKPEFNIVLTHDEIHLLKSHAVNSPISEQVYRGINKDMLFGHSIKEQRKTPYLEAIIGALPRYE